MNVDRFVPFPRHFLLCLLFLRLASAQSSQIESSPPDSVSPSAAEADSLEAGRFSPPTTISLTADQLADFDHEEFGDWIAVMPGFYPLDRAGYASAQRGLMLGLPPTSIGLQFRDRPVVDHLLGAPELGWIPPEAVGRMEFSPLSFDLPGAAILVNSREVEPVPPASHIAVRDGYYGLGNVDFDLAQKVTPATVLSGGGRVSTYGGRLPHSEGYGLNLRCDLAFNTAGGLQGWGGVMQNKLNAEVPFGSSSHNRDRYEADLALRLQALQGHLYGLQQRETYGGGMADAWDEIGFIARWDNPMAGWHNGLEATIAQARWRMKGLEWSNTSSGSMSLKLESQPLPNLAGQMQMGMSLCDDFYPERHLGLNFERKIVNWLYLNTGALQNQRAPSRFEGWADFNPGEHFLPYEPVFLRYPDLPLQGNRSLKNETYTTLQAGARIEHPLVTGSLSVFWRQVDDPIVWFMSDGFLKSQNASAERAHGALGWIQAAPAHYVDLGATASFVPLASGERRLYPETMAHAWVQFRQKLFQNQLELRLRIWEDFWGRRYAPVPQGWNPLNEAYVLSARISARLLGVRLFWEVNNILHRNYQLYPGFQMMHKEEVWGISWDFIN